MPQPIAEWSDVDPGKFRAEILPRYQPAVMRGLAAQWPAVGRGRESDDALCDYLVRFDAGAAVDVLRMPPSVRGRIFYNESLDGFNFTRDRQPLASAIERMRRNARLANGAAVAVQSAPIAECLPGFVAENALEILPPSVAPRIWLGNSVVTPAHFDESSNVACVVAGRRRFTLFPPEEIANLYIGPIGYAPTGTPISLVSFREPDFTRFPRFRQALEAAQVAELGPGDAIYIPALWWHHVESLDQVNMLVNYWWKGEPGSATRADSALDALLLSLLALRHLPAGQRAAWGRMFEHYIFDANADPAGHVPEARRGVLGEITPELAAQVRAFVKGKLGG
jgi:hypothetical protein